MCCVQSCVLLYNYRLYMYISSVLIDRQLLSVTSYDRVWYE
nr:MAG TPA: hypothetical protein [Caudoviricetes sp.]